MKRFRFPLETARRWRLEQLSFQELKLRQILAEKQALESAKQQIAREASLSTQGVLSQSSMLAVELEELDSFRQYSRGRVQHFENQQKQCESRIIAQREKVMEARRQFELLDRLRQKAWNQWRAAGNKEQEELAAELFLAKSIRARRQS